MDKRISLRFDIDSISCVKKGLPGLSAVADRYNIPLTVFVTMGKAIVRRDALCRLLSQKKPGLSPVRRLGMVSAMRTFILNPSLGIDNAQPLLRLQDKGHELGLHGGRNHGWWQRHALSADIETLRDDLDWGYDAFVKLFGKPTGFAAPGFVWSASTLTCVDEKGFVYASDMDGASPFHPQANGRTFTHWQVPVTVCGPSHIPFIEWACMQVHSERDFLAELSLQLARTAPAVLYGHPCWEGTAGAAYLTTAIEWLIDKGYSFVRMRDLVPGSAGAS